MKPGTTRPTTRRRFGALVAVAAALTGAGLWHWLDLNPVYDGASLSVTDAHRQAGTEAVLLVDIRRPDEWRSTGIGAGAYPLDMRRDDFVDALERLAGGDSDRAIALICARGVRSARLSKRLADAGFTRIIDVPEGMLGSAAGPGWLALGLPVHRYEGTGG